MLEPMLEFVFGVCVGWAVVRVARWELHLHPGEGSESHSAAAAPATDDRLRPTLSVSTELPSSLDRQVAQALDERLWSGRSGEPQRCHDRIRLVVADIRHPPDEIKRWLCSDDCIPQYDLTCRKSRIRRTSAKGVHVVERWSQDGRYSRSERIVLECGGGIYLSTPGSLWIIRRTVTTTTLCYVTGLGSCSPNDLHRLRDLVRSSTLGAV